MRIGIVGAHRVGKTTLAENLSKTLDIPFVKTNVSKIFERFGVDPSRPIPFKERLNIQNEILADWEKRVFGLTHFIVDRTPVDFAGYLMLEYNTSTAVNTNEMTLLQALRYKTLCGLSHKDNIDMTIQVHPGIPVEKAEWKGNTDPMLIHSLDFLITGLAASPSFKRPDADFFSVPRNMIDLDKRAAFSFARIKPELLKVQTTNA